MKVQTATLNDGDVKLSDLLGAKKNFPQACQDEFVERWAVTLVREAVREKASLPETFFTELKRRLAGDQASAVARKPTLVSTNINHIYKCNDHI